MTFDTEHIDLAGQVAIVTGGGRGLGRSMAQALAHAGAMVAVVARSEAQLVETVDLIRAENGRALAVPGDITDPAFVDRMALEVDRQLGPPDLLVNNAGYMIPPGPIWEADPEDWRRSLDVNLTGAFLCARAVLRGMIQRQCGRIVNIASGAALSPLPNGHGYCVSKAALLRLTECLAVDAGEHGITVFAIDPGTVRVGMTEYLLESEAAEKYLSWFRPFVEGGGAVSIELCGRLVTLLASGQADKLSGRFISVTDDVDRMIREADQIQEGDLYTLRLGQLPE